jgi:hypothetical protein
MRLQNAVPETLFWGPHTFQYIHLTFVRDRLKRIYTFKEFEMKKQLIWVLSAVLLGGSSMAAIASNHGMDKHAEHRSHGKRSGGQGAEAHLAKLEGALKLEDAQRPAWNAFANGMKELSEARTKQRGAMHDAMKKAKDDKTMGVTERMEARGQMMQVQQAQLAQMKQITQTLLPQLTTAQQIVFNAEWSDGFGHNGRQHHGHAGKRDHREACKS